MVQADDFDVGFTSESELVTKPFEITNEQERELHDALSNFGKSFYIKLVQLLNERRNGTRNKIDMVRALRN